MRSYRPFLKIVKIDDRALPHQATLNTQSSVNKSTVNISLNAIADARGPRPLAPTPESTRDRSQIAGVDRDQTRCIAKETGRNAPIRLEGRMATQGRMATLGVATLVPSSSTRASVSSGRGR